MSRNVCILGAASHWGVRQVSARSGSGSRQPVWRHTRLKQQDVDGIIVASAFTERSNFQTHLAPLGRIPVIKLKNICAAPNCSVPWQLGIILAYGLIKSGIADVMVTGGENLHRKNGKSLQRAWHRRSWLGRLPGLGFRRHSSPW